eukprot:TRINITY_DN29259_c0_g2_i2.p1 TRINITY_DN29259_c0_g2~~TRINITY_DN29259_c0_g2_i2.p1  ORF type:complete len:166 (+),score=17.75 TRINITY_DN29259_c0_g2_i2:33-500(+)
MTTSSGLSWKALKSAFRRARSLGPMGTIRKVLSIRGLKDGRLVGEDQFGNKYYTNTEDAIFSRTRWVEPIMGFNDALNWNPTSIPPEWHSWLHYQTDEEPSSKVDTSIKYRKEHHPTLTGTTKSYHPPGWIFDKKTRDEKMNEWSPDNKPKDTKP